jgi:uncharacterized protein YfaS (alpha-2-macroglobulin family)
MSELIQTKGVTCSKKLIFYRYTEENDIGYLGYGCVTTTVPEAITTYSVRGVAMSEHYGIGLSDPHSNITIFMPFFISLELPIYVKRGEIVTQNADIFNYLKKGQTVTVSVEKNSRYTMVNLSKYGWTGKLICKLNIFYANY